MTTTITLDDEQRDVTRRAILAQAATDLKNAAQALGHLAEVAPWPAGVCSSDAQSAVSMVRESLGVLDALGWPEDEAQR